MLRIKALASILAGCVAASAVPLAAQGTSDAAEFIKAVREGDGGKATTLLSAPGSTVANARDYGTGESALHIAVRRRDVPWTRFMIQRGVDPDTRDKAGDTPLGLAARLGFSEGARVLIAGGARVDGANARGETPLIIAVQARQLDLVRMFVRQGANPDKTDSAAGYSAKDYARQDNRAAAILKVLEEGRKPAAKPAAAAATPPR